MALEIITRVQTILNVDASKIAVLNEIVNIQSEALLQELGTQIIPAELEYIVVETSISRYNRLGSEGLKSENIDVISQTFIEDLLSPYHTVIQRYKNKNSRLKML